MGGGASEGWKGGQGGGASEGWKGGQGGGQGPGRVRSQHEVARCGLATWPGRSGLLGAPPSPSLGGGGRRRDTHHRVHGHPHAPGGRALRGRQVGLEGSRRHRGFRPRLLRHRGARGGGEELLLQQEVSGFCWGLRTPPDAWICPNNLRSGPGTGPSGSLPSRSKAKVQTAERSRPFGPGSFGAHLPGRGRAAKGGGRGHGGRGGMAPRGRRELPAGALLLCVPPRPPLGRRGGGGGGGGAPGGHPLAEHWPDEHPPRPPDAHAQRRPSWDSLTTTAPSSTPRCAPPRPPPPRPPAPRRPRARALLGGGVWGVGKGGPNAAPAGQTDREDTA